MTTMNSPPSAAVTIIGSGALGSLFAAFMQPQTAIGMLTHWPDQMDAIRSAGLTCLHVDGSSSTHAFPVTNDLRGLAPVQFALVLVKSFQTARAAFELAPIMAADGIAVTLQNGLGNFEILEAALGHGRVAQGITAQGATMIGPGKVRHAGHGMTTIATISGKQEQLEDFVSLLNHAGLPAQMSDNVSSLQWGKLAVNAGINPLTALLRVRNGFLAENEAARQIMCAAAEECAAVASQLGISLPYEDAGAQVIEVAETTASNQSSMLQDVLRGAPTEIDAISGAVASYGRQVDVPTPLNDELWRLVTGLRVGSPTDAGINDDTLLQDLLQRMK